MDQKVTADEFLESMNGFDEIAIEQRFGDDVLNLAQKQPTRFTRALVFVLLRRDGKSDAEAYQSVMEMGLGAVQNYFADEEDEVMPEEPTSAAGKDGSPLG